MSTAFIDTHAHVSFHDYSEEEVPLVVERAKAAGVAHIINIGAGEGMEGNRRAQEVAERFSDYLSFTVGVHPHDAKTVSDADFVAIEEMSHHPQVVGIGEVGLDYYYAHSPQEVQIEVLKRFTAMSLARKLPMVIHDRGAEEGCYELLRAEGKGAVRGVVHCFTGTVALAKKYLDLGFLLSFTGIITFKKADDVREVVRMTPLDRIMIETDSPYLAPVPYRGKRNEPAYVALVAKKIAEIKGRSLEEVAAQTTKNAKAFFNL